MSGRLAECDCDDSVAGWSRPIQRWRRCTTDGESHSRKLRLLFLGVVGWGRAVLLIKSCPVAHYNKVVSRSILILFISICSGLGHPFTSRFSAFFFFPSPEKPSQSLSPMFLPWHTSKSHTHRETAPNASPGDSRVTARQRRPDGE